MLKPRFLRHKIYKTQKKIEVRIIELKLLENHWKVTHSNSKGKISKIIHEESIFQTILNIFLTSLFNLVIFISITSPI